MKTEAINKKDKTQETPRFSLAKIKEGLKELTLIQTGDLTKVSGEAIQENIQNTLSAIRVLEAQLKDTTEVNSALRLESKGRDSEITTLKRTNEDLQFRLKELEKVTPHVGDLEERMDIAVEKIEEYKTHYEHEKIKAKEMAAQLDFLSQKLKKTEEERDDAYKEVVLLMNKMEPVVAAKGTENG